MPPRFQKQHGQGPPESGAQSGQTPVSPQSGQPPMSHTGGQTSPGMRHGPPHWYGDPRTWASMPPPGYGPGRPMDMPGMIQFRKDWICFVIFLLIIKASFCFVN